MSNKDLDADSAAQKSALEAAYDAGFAASGEGWNNEYRDGYITKLLYDMVSLVGVDVAHRYADRMVANREWNDREDLLATYCLRAIKAERALSDAEKGSSKWAAVSGAIREWGGLEQKKGAPKDAPEAGG